MKSIKNIREENPEYDDLSDQEISDRLYSKYYSDMDKTEFEQKIGLQAAQLDAPPETTEPEKKLELSDFAAYGFQEQLSDVEMVTKRWLAEQKNPFVRYLYGSRFMGLGLGDADFDMGKGFELAVDVYGEDFVWDRSLDADDRIAIMDKVSADSLEQNHPEVSEYLKEQELSTKQELALAAGKTGGALTTPTIAVGGMALQAPSFLQKIIHGSFIGGLWGTEYNAADQYMKTGKVDLAEAVTSEEAISGAIGGGVLPVAGAVIVRGTRKAKEQISKIRENAKAVPLSESKAAKVAGKVNEKTRQYQLEGLKDPAIAVQRAADDLGLSDQTKAQIAPLIRPLKQEEIAPTLAKIEAEANARGAVSRAAKTAIDTKMGLKPLAKMADYVFGVAGTRIANISEEAFRTMRRFEFKNKELSSRMASRVEPFMIGIGNLDDEPSRQITKLLMNGDYDEAYLTLQSMNKPQLADATLEVRDVLTELYDLAAENGIDMQFVHSYFPRTVKDLGKLQTYLGTGGNDLTSFIKAKALADGHIQSKLESIDGLDDEIISKYVNDFLVGKTGLSPGSGYTKHRGVAYIDDDLSQFYEQGAVSLDRYITRLSKDIALKEVTGEAGNIEKSIGAIVAKAGAGLTKDETQELTSLIQSRFISGDRQMSSPLAKMRDMQTASLLAQPTAAIVQASDVAWSIVKNGVKESWEGILKRNLTSEELGLVNTVSQDIVTGRGWTTRLLKWSGFRAVDKMTKDTYINAAINKARAIAERNPQKFNEMYRRYFGDEVEAVARDLKSGEITENVKLLAFNELSDVQPISLMEMPQAYLDEPNFRILFALKSWGIKQLDILRREALQKLNSSDRKVQAEGLGTLMKFGLVVLPAQATTQEVREALRGNPMEEPGELFDRVTDQAISSSVIIGNKYMADKAFDNPITTMMSSFAPAAGRLGDRAYQAVKEGDVAGLIGLLPGLGDVYYNWFGGGMEKKQEKRQKEKIKELRKTAY